MKLSKRQLKRIIREEYSRLKRRGLIEGRHDDYGPGSALSQLKFFARNKVESAGWEMMLGNFEQYNNGDFARYCEECGCSSDEQMLQCIMDYAADELVDDIPIIMFTDFIAKHSGRYV